MPTTLSPALEYDPVKFIKNNSRLILPAHSKIRNIEFSGFIKKAFHSNKRPKGVITVTYQTSNSENDLRLFVKQHAKAKQVFNHIAQIYAHFKAAGIDPRIPKPIICDEKHDVNYMEYIEGSSLTYILLKELMIGNKIHLESLFYKIGSWLKGYHNSFKLEKTFAINTLREKVTEELNNTDHFKTHEKVTIKANLKDLKLEDDFLVLVKTHNDFTLRNIIYTKTKSFYVIDWDAIYNENFTIESPIWIDILSFLISFNSLQRFSPFITANDLSQYNKSFITGYFNHSDLKLLMKDINSHLYFFSLCFYLGVIGEKPLPWLYRDKLGYRYISILRRNLIKGYLL